MACLTLDTERHEYRLDGQRLPSVTQMLSALGYGGNGAQYYTPASRELGIAVDAVCSALDCYPDRGWRDIFKSLDPDLIPYAEGYLLMRRETGFVPGRSQHPLYSARLRLAGTPDNVGMADGKPTIIDVKSGTASGGFRPRRSHELQVAAYAIMESERILREDHLTVLPEQIQRWIVLLPKGKVYRCEDPGDLSVVQCCAVVYADLVSWGLLKMNGETGE